MREREGKVDIQPHGAVAHMGLNSQGSLGKSVGLDHWGSEKVALVYSNQSSDLGRPHFGMHTVVPQQRAQPCSAICIAQLVALSGYSAWLAALPDLGPQLTSHTSCGACSVALFGQGSTFPTLPDCRD